MSACVCACAYLDIIFRYIFWILVSYEANINIIFFYYQSMFYMIINQIIVRVIHKKFLLSIIISITYT